jgi:hypothetical protein
MRRRRRLPKKAPKKPAKSGHVAESGPTAAMLQALTKRGESAPSAAPPASLLEPVPAGAPMPAIDEADDPARLLASPLLVAPPLLDTPPGASSTRVKLQCTPAHFAPKPAHLQSASLVHQPSLPWGSVPAATQT